MNFDVVSADNLGRRAADMDADTVLDDRSVDEILTFALGTDERPFHQQLHRPLPRASAPTPPPYEPRVVAAAFTVPPPVMPGGYPPEYPAGVPVVAAPSEQYPLQYPHTGPFHYPDLSQPYPLQTVTARSVAVRWGIPALALILVAGSGLAFGKFLFADDGAPAAQPAATAAATPPATAPPPAAAATTPPAPAAAAPEPAVEAPPPAAPTGSLPAVVTAEVASLTHPTSAAVSAPTGGTITQAYLVGSRKVRAGEKLFEVTSKAASGAKERVLANKVKELERLAAQDPVYQDFLERARKERDRARPRRQSVLVQAPSDGVFQAMVARGDRVDARQALASRPDRKVWLTRVTLRGEARPGTNWSCAITPAGGETADQTKSRCTIEQIVDEEGGVEVTVRIASRDAPWLEAGGSGHQLTFEPPAAASP